MQSTTTEKQPQGMSDAWGRLTGHNRHPFSALRVESYLQRDYLFLKRASSILRRLEIEDRKYADLGFFGVYLLARIPYFSGSVYILVDIGTGIDKEPRLVASADATSVHDDYRSCRY